MRGQSVKSTMSLGCRVAKLVGFVKVARDVGEFQDPTAKKSSNTNHTFENKFVLFRSPFDANSSAVEPPVPRTTHSTRL